MGDSETSSPRIISLIASATEIVCSLGARDQLVGISHECDFPEGVAALPVCSHAKLRTDVPSGEIDSQVKSLLRDAISIYGLELETIDGLRPTHLITQSQCDVCAVSLSDVQAAVCETLISQPEVVVCEPNNLSDIWADVRRVGKAIGRSEEAESVVSNAIDALSRVRPSGGPSERVRVACVEWVEPLMAAGNWVPELVELAGAESVIGEAGKHSPWLTYEELAVADPDLIVVMPCGFDLERTLAELPVLYQNEVFRGLRAVRAGEVIAVDGNSYFNRPGPRVVESAEILREAIDAMGTNAAGDGVRWARVVPAV